MSGLFTVPAAPGNDFNKGSQFSALIKYIAIRKTGEDASQWQDLGPLENGSLSIKQGRAMAQGQQPVALRGYAVEIKADALSVNDATRVAIDQSNEVGVDVRVTCVGGEVYTFNYTDGTDLVFTESREGQTIDGAAKFQIEIGGSISKAVYDTCYTAAP